MTTTLNLYKEHFDKANKEHIAGYLQWKETRHIKIAQTKALRLAKASARENATNVK
jgi:hypothetical protein